MKSVYDPALIGLQVSRPTANNELLVFCPYHNDSHASATYNWKKGVLYCFGCQVTKSAHELAHDLGGALIEMPTIPDMWFEAEAESIEWRYLLSNPKADGHPYLKRRLVPDHLIHRYNIKASNPKAIKGSIIFPIQDVFRNFVGVQLRQLDKQPKYMFYGNRYPVWPVRNLIGRELASGPIFLVEGVFGALRAASAGVCALAIMGASAVSGALEFLSYYNTRRPVYAAMDRDYAGLLAAGKFILNGVEGVFVPWGEDPDDWAVTQWRELAKEPERFSTSDVMIPIDKSTNSARMQQTLEKYYNRRSKNNGS